jgi:hypothetical protein
MGKEGIQVSFLYEARNSTYYLLNITFFPLFSFVYFFSQEKYYFCAPPNKLVY